MSINISIVFFWAVRCSLMMRLGIVLLNDNTCPDTVAHIIKTIQKLGWETFQHPAHCPDFTPSDHYHTPNYLKNPAVLQRFKETESA